ncbi:hypothetical protein HMPREF1141_2702 [Clostridium sp. MSTE9]|nr:hypothetical protein HMPREF1141_2702 [Clostridium sp. MSTE9]
MTSFSKRRSIAAFMPEQHSFDIMQQERRNYGKTEGPV